MRRVWPILTLFAGCAAPQDQEPSEAAVHAANLSKSFESFLAEPWVGFRFEFSAADDRGSKTVRRGVVRGYRGGVLLVEEAELRVLRVGPRAWRFDTESQTWVPYSGKDRPGTGFQNPSGLVTSLQSQRNSFKPSRRQCDTAPWIDYELDPAPPHLAETFHCLMPDLIIDLKATRMKAEVLDEHRGIGLVEVSGTVRCRQEGIETSSQAHVRLLRQFDNTRPPMKFEGVSVPFTAEMQASILKAQGETK